MSKNEGKLWLPKSFGSTSFGKFSILLLLDTKRLLIKNKTFFNKKRTNRICLEKIIIKDLEIEKCKSVPKKTRMIEK